MSIREPTGEAAVKNEIPTFELRLRAAGKSRSGQWAECLSDSLILVARPDRTEKDVIRCASAQLALKNPQHAIEMCDIAIEMNPPGSATVFSIRAQAWSQLRQFDNSWSDFQKAIELRPNHHVAYHNLGDLHFGFQKYQEAVRDYTRAFELNLRGKGRWKSLMNRGLAYLNLGFFEEARNDLLQVLQQQTPATALFGLGLAWRSTGSVEWLEGSQRSFQKFLQQTKTGRWSIWMRVLAQYYLGRPQEVAKEILAAKSLDADFSLVYEDLKLYYAVNEEFLAMFHWLGIGSTCPNPVFADLRQKMEETLHYVQISRVFKRLRMEIERLSSSQTATRLSQETKKNQALTRALEDFKKQHSVQDQRRQRLMKTHANEVATYERRIKELQSSLKRLAAKDQAKIQKIRRLTDESASATAANVTLLEQLEQKSLDLGDPTRIRELERTIEQLEEARTCVVCMDAPRTVTLLPCRHHIICPKCARSLRVCPLCRKRIKRRVHTFS